MPKPPDLGPITLDMSAERWRFTLTAPDEIALELPNDFEEHLDRRLAPLLAADPPQEVVMDLEDLPAISSRQLGLMLTLHRILSDRYGKLPLVGVSEPIRRLLNLTRTVRFFDLP